MQLTYRGVSYELNPPRVEMVNTQISAKFLGVSYPVRRPTYSRQAVFSNVSLRYRGVPYSKTLA